MCQLSVAVQASPQHLFPGKILTYYTPFELASISKQHIGSSPMIEERDAYKVTSLSKAKRTTKHHLCNSARKYPSSQKTLQKTVQG